MICIESNNNAQYLYDNSSKVLLCKNVKTSPRNPGEQLTDEVRFKRELTAGNAKVDLKIHMLLQNKSAALK